MERKLQNKIKEFNIKIKKWRSDKLAGVDYYSNLWVFVPEIGVCMAYASTVAEILINENCCFMIPEIGWDKETSIKNIFWMRMKKPTHNNLGVTLLYPKIPKKEYPTFPFDDFWGIINDKKGVRLDE
jgi:hypothetical protein